MTEYAFEVPATSPARPATIQPAPDALRCTLCETTLPMEAERCPQCGLWKGGWSDPATGPVLLRVGAAFAALYLVALLIVALAR